MTDHRADVKKAASGPPEPREGPEALGDLQAVVERLTDRGVELWEDAGELRFRAPAGALDEASKSALRRRRGAVLEYLREDVGPGLVHPDPEHAHDPFPLTHVQTAYLLGRSDALDYGGVGCQVYLEVELDPATDPARVVDGWRHLVRRHDMLRAVVDERGFQSVRADVPEIQVPELDLQAVPADVAQDRVHRIRQEMCDTGFAAGSWPMFAVRLTRTPRTLVMHLSFDLVLADFASVQLLLDELHHLVRSPEVPLATLDTTFRDCLAAQQRLQARRGYQRSRQYWWDRVDTLPPAPRLPLRPGHSTRGHAGFRRLELHLDTGDWTRLRDQAAAHGLTPSVVLLAAYAGVIDRWATADAFTLAITLLNRPQVHEQVDQVVGDFSAVSMLEVRPRTDDSFATGASRIQAQLFADIDHVQCSGVEVLREVGARRGRREALIPVVFTSALGLDQTESPFWRDATLAYGLTQTPQVWVDCQALVVGDGAVVNWDVREDVFPVGLVEDMFSAFEGLVRGLVDDERTWDEPMAIPLPPEQEARRREVDDVDDPSLPSHRLLYEAFLEQALSRPDRPALEGSWGTLTYGELAQRSVALAERLSEAAGSQAAPVAVMCDRGPEQVVGVLGVLLAGAAYVPVDTTQPIARRAAMLEDAGVRTVVTQEHLEVPDSAGGGVRRLDLPAADESAAGGDGDVRGFWEAAREAPTPEMAYVIYTSGSTGTPKGVRISHHGALNTVEDVNRRFGVGESDAILGLTNLGFDLSVYDVFGPLSVGARLVLPDHDQRSMPSHWVDLVERHRVTIWNSVPAHLQMLADVLRGAPGSDVSSLRLALLSGDWIPVDLPDRVRALVPRLQVVSLGGATEGSIWSIARTVHDVDPTWSSIPYGRALTNQRVLVLDLAGRVCPDEVVGEIHLAGAGVALGYLGDPVRTAERFVTRPGTGEPMYRTGDLGRYRPDGDIEFLGREDGQVKIRGHRVEVAEVEAAVLGAPDVARAAVVVHGGRGEARIVAFVEPGPARDDGSVTADDVAEVAAAAAREAAGDVDRDEYAAYLRHLDELALLCMMRAFQEAGLFAGPQERATLEEVVERTGVPARHHRVVRRWVGALLQHGLLRQADDRRLRSDRAVDAAEIDRGWARADDAVARLDPDAAAVHDYFKAATSNLLEVLRSDGPDAVELLFPQGRVDVGDSLYNLTLFNRWANTVLADSITTIARSTRGTLRVLEVGAGVGGTSKPVLAALDGEDVEYTFTDLSQFFLNRAQETFGDRDWVRYTTLDIDEDYRAQGFAPNSFDVILLGDVFHATRNVGGTLAALRELLAPGGWLVFAEMTRDHYQIMTSMELLLTRGEGDFTDQRCGRDQTFIGHEDWLQMLGHELVFAVPESGDPFTDIGLYVYGSRVKADRAPLRPKQVLDAVRDRLPPAMVPSAVQVVDQLPVTTNGKVDRSALADMVLLDPVTTDGDVFEDDLEHRLAERWSVVLGRTVGRGHRFYDLGGDSLLASQLAGTIAEEVPEAAPLDFGDLLRILLEGPTVAELADRLRADS